MPTAVLRVSGKVTFRAVLLRKSTLFCVSFDDTEKKTMIDELCQPQRSTVLINYRHLSNFNDRLARVIQDEYYR